MPRLKPEILAALSKKLGLSKNSVRQYISRERTNHPKATLNAAAQLFALSNKTTVLRMLDKEDRATLPSNIEIAKEKIILENKKEERKKKRYKPLLIMKQKSILKKDILRNLIEHTLLGAIQVCLFWPEKLLRI